MRIRFCPIASGSDGNCLYIGTPGANILVDAGTSGIKISDGLSKIGVSPKDIDAVFITHDHSDHTKGAGIFSRRFDAPVYATEGTWRVMRPYIGKLCEENIRYISADTPSRINDMEVVPFEIPHDAAEPVGFSVLASGAKITVATDIGYASDSVSDMLIGSDIVLLETNHDVDMLKQGPYPYYLKKRILSDVGHLSNTAAGNLLAKIISPKLKHVYLGHLSGENNTPSLAFETVSDILRQNAHCGGFKLSCAKRGEVSAICEV